MKARKVLLGGSIVAETLSSIDPSREYKQSFIQEWQDSWSINQEEWWKLRGDKVSSDVLKSSNAYLVPRSFLIRASLGEAISSGLHDLETNGPRWWRVWSDKDWDRLTMPYHVDLEGYSTSRFGDDWWEIYEEGIWKWKKYSVPFWQMLEYERQGQMLHYSRVHFFGNDYEASDLDYDASKIWDMLENQLLQRVTNLYEHAGCRLERIGPIFGRAWDYRHFANCIISNLEGKPYLYRHL